MSITRSADTLATGKRASGGSNNLVWSFTCGTLTNGLLYVAGVIDGSSSVTASADYNGVSMTQQAQKHYELGGFPFDGLLYTLVNPNSGTHNVTITCLNQLMCFHAFTYEGVDQTTPCGTAVTDAGTSGTPSVVASSATGELVADVVCSFNLCTVGSGQTQRANDSNSGDFVACSDEPGASSVTMSWTMTSEDWIMCAVPLKPATASGLVLPREYGSPVGARRFGRG